ncbi:DUF1045 domain-containing protein [Burkholderia cepacia]|uniref:DUF1045 domain-containing protein n=1 Tax=Burkholderia cepacia TaxID=292 RepID=UPI002AB60473|nr:DUF1045 domain-containing protein [Burkholderia cepacia]
MVDVHDAPRYAIYYSPAADQRLTQMAARWLGRDAFTGRVVSRDDVSDDVHALVIEPRRYGFHATLKAPFRLAEGFAVGDLERALGEFAEECAPCALGRLKLDVLGDFFALRPAQPVPTLLDFAGRIVETFDRFRAPLSQTEMKRRLSGSLDDTETSNVMRWGYPYVFDRYRFHMTLTGHIAPDLRPSLLRRLEQTFDPLLEEDYSVDALALFAQTGSDGDFVVRSWYPLGNRATNLRD